MKNLKDIRPLRGFMIIAAVLGLVISVFISTGGVTFAEETAEIPKEGVKYKLTYPDGTVVTENEDGEPLTYDDVVRLQKEENWRKIGSGLVTDSEGKIVLPESWKKGMIKIVETQVPEGYTWGSVFQQIADLTLGSVTFINPKVTEPTDPTETEPTEPTETKPTEPTETEPTETDPTKSEEPTESTEPTESDKPTESEKPIPSTSETETAETTTTASGETTTTVKPESKNDSTTQTPAATKKGGASSAAVNEAAGKTAADTGDRNLTGLWAGLIAAAAGVGVVATAVVLRKRKKN